MFDSPLNPTGKYDSKYDVETVPLSEVEEGLVNKYFKPCYLNRVKIFAETAPAFRRKKFFEMLNLASGRAPNNSPERPVDYAFTLNGGFGLSYSFNGKRSSRKINPLRFSSPGITDNKIFGFKDMGFNQSTSANPLRMISTSIVGSRQQVPQIHFTITRMANPEFMHKLLDIAEEYSAIWIELGKTLDRNMGYPTKKMSNSQQYFGSTTFTTIMPDTFEQNATGVKMPAEERSPNPRRMNLSLRLNDPALRELYQSDSRWSPKVTAPLS